MKKRMTDTIKSSLKRPLFKCGFVLEEKGTNGAGRWARSNKSGIAEFCYHYNGTVGGNNYSYKVADNNGRVTFSYESMLSSQSGEAVITVDKSVLESLNSIYFNCRLAEWNGYSKYAPDICDGEGFSLSIKFNDGALLTADGMNAFPRRYSEFCAAMKAVFDPLIDLLLKSPADKI